MWYSLFFSRDELVSGMHAHGWLQLWGSVRVVLYYRLGGSAACLTMRYILFFSLRRG